MIRIDGSKKSGSGTIVRDSVSFSILAGEDLHLTNIRAKRGKPGLRPQHLKALEACAQICQGRLEGGTVGAREITFRPGGIIRGGKYEWDIGTAGSAIMLAMTVMPVALFADSPSTYKITGGLFQDFAPSVFHFKYVLLPMLERMGVKAHLKIISPGYVPRGGGQIELDIQPAEHKLKPLTLTEQGQIMDIKGIALSSHLEERKVSERMAEACEEKLHAAGYSPAIKVIYDTQNSPAFERVSAQPGAALAVWAGTSTDCVIGADMAGALGRTAELIGKQTAGNLLHDLKTGATVDRYLADQLIPYAALAGGESAYSIPEITGHIESRMWLVEKILGARTVVKDNILNIEGIGFLQKKNQMFRRN